MEEFFNPTYTEVACKRLLEPFNPITVHEFNRILEMPKLDYAYADGRLFCLVVKTALDLNLISLFGDLVGDTEHATTPLAVQDWITLLRTSTSMRYRRGLIDLIVSRTRANL